MWSLLPSRRDFATFVGLASLKIDSSHLRNISRLLSFWKFVLTPSFLVREPCLRFPCAHEVQTLRWTRHQVFSLRVINFVIVLHFLLAPVNTVVKPSRARICSSSKSASRGVARLSIESWVEDNNDWLYGKEYGWCINPLPLSSISGIWPSSVEWSISYSVTIGLSTVLLGP